MREHTEKTGEVVTCTKMCNFSTAHDGVCYKNSNLNPASAEGPQAAMAARELLLDREGHYVGDDKAIFGVLLNSDNDSCAVSNFSREQNGIIGTAADNLAEHAPDSGHVRKNNNNAMFTLKNNDRSFSGTNQLNPLRIQSINHDITSVVDDYKENLGDPVARQDCLDQLGAIIYHHCGIHDHCKQERFCTFLRIKNANPDLNDDDIAAKAAEESLRPHGGKNMSLSQSGIQIMTAKISERYNEKTIDKIARGGCSNASESFWSVNTKFSEGKKICQDHTDKWEVTNKLTFCRSGEGNIERTHEQVFEKLNLPITSGEKKYETTASKKRKKDKQRQDTDKYKRGRLFAKITRNLRMGQVDAKNKHKSGAFPLSESGKSSVADESEREKSPVERHCTVCRQPGHMKPACKMPPNNKRKAIELTDWDVDELNMFEERRIKASTRRVNALKFVEDWV